MSTRAEQGPTRLRPWRVTKAEREAAPKPGDDRWSLPNVEKLERCALHDFREEPGRRTKNGSPLFRCRRCTGTASSPFAMGYAQGLIAGGGLSDRRYREQAARLAAEVARLASEVERLATEAEGERKAATAAAAQRDEVAP